MNDDSKLNFYWFGAVFGGFGVVCTVLLFVFLFDKIPYYFWYFTLIPFAISALFVFMYLHRKDKLLHDLLKTKTAAEHERDIMRNLIQNIHDGLIVTDDKERILLLNFSALRTLAIKQEDVANKVITDFIPIQEYINKAIENLSVSIRNAVNNPVDLNISITPLLEQGQYKGSIYTMRNVTEQNSFEKLKLDFVAQVAHQLRTPLSVSRNYLFMFLKKNGPKFDPQETKYIERAYSGIDRLGALIDNLLNIARIEKGELKPQKRSSSIEDVINQTIERVMNFAVQKNIKIKFNHPSERLPVLMIDPLLVSEAFNNLLENAVDFSKNGGEIEVDLQKNEVEIIVSIKDYGIGIPTDALDKIFTKFYKVTNDLQQTSQGIGLGLYNAKAIIESHHGKIWVNSILGRGSTFSFSLPFQNLGQ